ncbi:MAG: D-alanyl-D-alanine carboxypeptidase/D-alanyl-D-alanine-endopeptidase [Ignavibacteriaceae bacterium]|nr:D-alanyl-D-alanine carboxypeptidase/D-alanyl-D-alanine-endopeptidase [Ignavibacteriaceae bacterium]
MKKTLILLLFFISVSFGTSREEIRGIISSIVQRLPASTKAGIIIYNPLTQDTIFQKNAFVSMTPASNTKLFTTAAALSMLGGDFPLYTKLITNDHNIKNGVINGDLYIKGYGNSTFTSSDLERMVKDLAHKGIKKITGQIIGDDNYFDDVYFRADWIPDEVTNISLPPISALVIDRNRVVTYKKVRRRMKAYTTNISDPPLFAAKLLREKLIAEGISVGTSCTKGEAPKNGIILSESKIILRDLIALINKHSDNFLAECLFKTIGAESSKQKGNSFYSTQAIINFLEENGVYLKGSSVVDGSGISRFDQVTPISISGILEKMYFDVANFDNYYKSLSIAGVDGTLRYRFKGTSAENNLHGKTGTLDGISSLSGYLTTARGDDLIISMIMEFDKRGNRFHHAIQDEIVKLLTDWK